MDNLFEEPLPEWAIRKSLGDYMEEGAQLRTRDGRRCGNAYIDSIEQHASLGQIAIVVTDMGSVMRMTFNEVADYFYRPEYIMDVVEARKHRLMEEK